MDLSRVDPELMPALEALQPRTDPVADPEAARAELLAKLGSGGPEHPAVERRDETITGPDGKGLRLRLYLPRERQAAPAPGLYWIHGGGFVMGAIEMDDRLCDSFVARFGCVVCSVGYRLAPEHPYPAGVEDCHAGLVWFSERSGRLGVDAGRIGIGGLSAGGGLTAATTLLARDRGQAPVAFSLALCAQIDDRHVTRSSQSVHDLRVWNTETSKTAWGAYLRDVGGDVPPYAAPARATDLEGLPPTFLLVGDLDPFCDENVEYARRLIEAGVPTELHVYPGAYHGFEVLAPEARVSRAALA
ncbi:MAG: alpha/beta hydrolase, partial [Deltaproteobacteria bacterium]|nr:alpha/beta hydrolase [Deltaproteobacteria bacterium]